MLRLSTLSGKVFAAFLVVLVTFGGVSAFGALTMHRLGDEVQRVAGDYMTLRLELHDLQTRQSNLVQFVERADDDTQRSTGFVKSAIDAARRYRKADVRTIEALAQSMLEGARSDGEGAFLRMLADRLRSVEKTFNEDEDLFDRVFGPPGTQPPALAPLLERRFDTTARQRLLAREAQLYKELGALMTLLRERAQGANEQLERDERRSVWATLLLSLWAAAVGLGVMWLTQRAIAPLKRLAASAQQIARGEYKHRVEVASDDEIGLLAGEFNAMAGALEEREARLIRSERLAAVGQIAAQITHEIRNPLSSIGLNAEMLVEELGEIEGGGDLSKLARAIEKEVDRLAAITEEYLKFARLPRPRLEREDLNAIVSSLLAFMREELGRRQIELHAELGPSLPPVAADENQIRQALLNLLRNGAEAMRTGGRLIVRTYVVSDGDKGMSVRVHIEDTGAGIKPDDLARIFDPFFTTKTGGTGLGLPLTQQIIVEHGGAIDVSSEPGRGTRFTVCLPALTPSAAGQLRREPTSEVSEPAAPAVASAEKSGPRTRSSASM